MAVEVANCRHPCEDVDLAALALIADAGFGALDRPPHRPRHRPGGARGPLHRRRQRPAPRPRPRLLHRTRHLRPRTLRRAHRGHRGRDRRRPRALQPGRPRLGPRRDLRDATMIRSGVCPLGIRSTSEGWSPFSVPTGQLVSGSAFAVDGAGFPASAEEAGVATARRGCSGAGGRWPGGWRGGCGGRARPGGFHGRLGPGPLGGDAIELAQGVAEAPDAGGLLQPLSGHPGDERATPSAKHAYAATSKIVSVMVSSPRSHRIPASVFGIGGRKLETPDT